MRALTVILAAALGFFLAASVFVYLVQGLTG